MTMYNLQVPSAIRWNYINRTTQQP